MRNEKDLGNPVAESWVGLFEPRKQCASKPEGDSNRQRSNKETAAQLVCDVPERQSQAFDHKSAFRDALSDGIFHRIRNFVRIEVFVVVSDCSRRANSSTADLNLLPDPVGQWESEGLARCFRLGPQSITQPIAWLAH